MNIPTQSEIKSFAEDVLGTKLTRQQTKFINAMHELKKENEELKEEIKKVITHYQCQTLAVKDRLAISNCSDIELSDAYDKLDLSETWLRDNYGHMKLDWF